MWAFFLFFPAVLGRYSGEFDHCVVSDSNPCSFSSFSNPTLIYPGGKTRCAYDTNKDLETNSTYSFQVYPGRSTDRKKLLIHFQGGGACISKTTCAWSTQQALAHGIPQDGLFQPRALPALEGMFDIDNPLNPYRNYTIVVVLYCTGDIHIGSRVIKNQISGIETHMNGLNNAYTVVQWVFQQIRDPEQVVVSGNSAGSLGMPFWSRVILNHFTKRPSVTSMAVITDAYPGYLSENQGDIFAFIGSCDPRLELDRESLERCEKNELYFPDVAANVHKSFPSVPFLVISSKHDIVQRGFYCLGKYRDGGLFKMAVNLDECLSAENFYKGIISVIKSSIETTDRVNNNVINFLVEGTQHVFLTVESFYTIKIGDISLTEWIKKATHQDLSNAILHSECTLAEAGCDPILKDAVYLGMDRRQHQLDENSKKDIETGAADAASAWNWPFYLVTLLALYRYQ